MAALACGVAFAAAQFAVSGYVSAQLADICAALDERDWPSLDVVNPKGEPVGGNPFTRPVVSTGGTPVLFAGIATAAVLRVHARVVVAEWAAPVRELRFAILAVTSVLALAHVMNLSGRAATIGHFACAAVGAWRTGTDWDRSGSDLARITADHSRVSATDPLGEPMPDPHPGQVVWGDQKYSGGLACGRCS